MTTPETLIGLALGERVANYDTGVVFFYYK